VGDKVDVQVCLFVFDLLYLNGRSLVTEVNLKTIEIKQKNVYVIEIDILNHKQKTLKILGIKYW
jgi:hypothetical protein